MCNMYKNHTQSEPKLSMATPVVWNAIVMNVENPTVPPGCLLVAKSPSTLHADQLGVFLCP